VLLTALWTALGLVRLLTHEMWRDELQAWMIARGSDTPLQLISNMRYEGHPSLWAFSLFVVSCVTDSPIGMQLLNLAIGSATAFILFVFAPFPRWVTVSIAFGYFVAYEYGTLSRSYGLGVLLIFTFCALFARARRGRALSLGLSLAMLASTSVYGVLAAAGLAAGGLWDGWIHRPGPGPGRRRRVAALAALAACGMLGTLYLVRQPPDAGFRIRPRIGVYAGVGLITAGSVWRGLVPIPPPERQFWNRDVLEGLPAVRAAAGLMMLATVLFVLRGSPAALLTFGVGGTGLLVFSYLIYEGGIRHHGHYFVLMTAACWMAATAPRRPTVTGWAPLLAGLAVIQLATGAFASAMDVRLTFSGSRNAASYIRAQYPPDTPIVVDPELHGVPVAAWLERNVYFAQSERYGGFVLWNNRQQPPDLGRAVDAADRLSAATHRDVLLVTTHQRVPPPRFRHVGHFEGAIVKEETYEVYLLRVNAGPSRPDDRGVGGADRSSAH
jgi:hypothetical protein